MQYVKIPRERIPVLVGENGQVKQDIEHLTGVKLNINSSEGTVDINGESAKDPLSELKVKDIIKAIGRGFNPDSAMGIYRHDLYFDLIDIKEYAGSKSKRIRQLKGRVIGKEGRTRRLIERLTDSSLSVYGYTVGIIGEAFNISIAKNAVDMILSGSTHAAVYQFLEGKQRDIKIQRQNISYEDDY